MPPIITLLTDFGTADSYVGEVKGTLLSRVHGAALFDITHQVPPGDLRAGQYILARVWHRFRSEEHTSELQSRSDLVCRLLLEKKKNELQYIHLRLTVESILRSRLSPRLGPPGSCPPDNHPHQQQSTGVYLDAHVL